jgi:hypothetical protein
MSQLKDTAVDLCSGPGPSPDASSHATAARTGPGKMLFTLVESFSPQDGERWAGYCAWRGIAFERFDSIDRILRPSLFSPKDGADWSHVVKEDFMIDIITDRSFAVEKLRRIGKGDIVGITFEDHDEHDPRFLGYDLIDGCCSVSLFTNWGNDHEMINRSLAANGLVCSFSVANSIRDELIKTASGDGHVNGCRVIAIYREDG